MQLMLKRYAPSGRLVPAGHDDPQAFSFPVFTRCRTRRGDFLPEKATPRCACQRRQKAKMRHQNMFDQNTRFAAGRIANPQVA
jgi:hypothetical protein